MALSSRTLNDLREEAGPYRSLYIERVSPSDPSRFEIPSEGGGVRDGYVQYLIDIAHLSLPDYSGYELHQSLALAIDDVFTRMNSGSPEWDILVSVYNGERGVIYHVASPRKTFNRRKIECILERGRFDPLIFYENSLEALEFLFQDTSLECSFADPAAVIIKCNKPALQTA